MSKVTDMRKIIQKLGRKNFVIIFSLFSILLFMASDFLLAYLLNHQFNYQDSILRTTVIFVIFLPLLLWQLSAGFYELGKLEKLVKNLSAHDELTGLLNKSMFYRSAEKLHKIAIRNKQYYCILLIDVTAPRGNYTRVLVTQLSH